ncbi:hypothetical protein F442_21476 [Phytophthora nicotianae P10297]|uniref:Uncharacterized protein n=1 Tax=Phytophthora nicotianae P10297 TaxID=1317064 RepID=W2Y331_PHYNI|nr:hypothetical protein F442_21476 [Phytophthora nicotianae P10297]
MDGAKRRRDGTLPNNSSKRRRVTRSSADDAHVSRAGWNVRFNDVWTALLKQGWTSKRPRGRSLDPRYQYIRTGGNQNGEDGKDFFLGEAAVLDHVMGGAGVDVNDGVNSVPVEGTAVGADENLSGGRAGPTGDGIVDSGVVNGEGGVGDTAHGDRAGTVRGRPDTVLVGRIEAVCGGEDVSGSSAIAASVGGHNKAGEGERGYRYDLTVRR